MQTPSKTPAQSAPPGSLISTSQMLARQDRLLHARPVLVASTTALRSAQSLSLQGPGNLSPRLPMARQVATLGLAKPAFSVLESLTECIVLRIQLGQPLVGVGLGVTCRRSRTAAR